MDPGKNEIIPLNNTYIVCNVNQNSLEDYTIPIYFWLDK